MSWFKDKSGMFEDFGFKLIVIDALLEKENSFSHSLSEMIEKYIDPFNMAIAMGTFQGDPFACIPQMVEYFENLVLTDEDLKQVDELCFDGGNEVYFYIILGWDGESDEFDVLSVEGFQLLPNLKCVQYISMCEPELMDVFRRAHITVK